MVDLNPGRRIGHKKDAVPVDSEPTKP